MTALRDTNLAGVLSLLSAISLLPGSRPRRSPSLGTIVANAAAAAAGSGTAPSNGSGGAASTAALAATASSTVGTSNGSGGGSTSIAASLAPVPFPDAHVTTNLITTGLRILNAIARLDIGLLQSFARKEQLQLYHIVSLLLPYVTAYYDSGSAAASGSVVGSMATAAAAGSGGGGIGSVKDMCRELILFIGYQCLCHTDNQWSYLYGQSPTLLVRLCNLPFYYYSDAAGKAVLFPTLLSVCFRNADNRRVVSDEINTSLFVDYLKSLQSQSQTTVSVTSTTATDSPAPAPTSANTKSDGKTSDKPTAKASGSGNASKSKASPSGGPTLADLINCELPTFAAADGAPASAVPDVRHRFPEVYWAEAIAFFTAKSSS